ncbi:HNH endonuclease [Rhodanobacter sp. PCA2]|uniref:HNH endonuclease n=1 Tax=Rhodanobacter sp. PCA2 TaxID=2006117 RepID=UPI0015E6904F|nr:HNH endonuclease [Rhodanobacter sp. PCA2]MBA2077135.1 restriction endonuclease [Rhodanobacter sp. PCA2]
MPDAIKLSSRASARKNHWTSEQLKLAFALYCRTPFGKLDSRNPQIVELAKLIGRTSDALAMKLVNFASLDPSITNTGRKGLGNASALDRKVWEEFHDDWGRLALECEQLRQKYLHNRGSKAEIPLAIEDDFALTDYTGETRKAIVQQRIKQDFFRRAVLASYGGRCCVSGVSDPRFLVASHIVPWRDDKANRLNPGNGLCLSAIHDKAFDKYLFSLTDDGRIVLSDQLKASKDEFLQKVFWPIEDQSIKLPDRFRPEPALLRNHRETMLRNQP